MSAVADVLNGAADLIERDGWCQRQYSDPQGRRCIDGAICAVAPLSHWTARVDARLLFQRMVDGDLIDWNDDPQRTKAEVVAALRAAAEQAEVAS